MANTILYCNRHCGTAIRFDTHHRSQSGKMIPIDAKTGEDHQCPNSDYNRAQTGQLEPSAAQQQQQKKQQQEVFKIPPSPPQNQQEQLSYSYRTRIEILEERYKELDSIVNMYIESLENKINELEQIAAKCVEKHSFKTASDIHQIKPTTQTTTEAANSPDDRDALNTAETKVESQSINSAAKPESQW